MKRKTKKANPKRLTQKQEAARRRDVMGQVYVVLKEWFGRDTRFVETPYGGAIEFTTTSSGKRQRCDLSSGTGLKVTEARDGSDD